MSEDSSVQSPVDSPVEDKAAISAKKSRRRSSHAPAENSLEEVLDKKIASTRMSGLQEILDQTNSVEEKIQGCLDAMTASLAGEGTPHFREFWQIKQLCLPLFKESISPKMRAQLWASYVELSLEAKRLKGILDEQSAFASEQIELALQAIERDVGLQETLVAQKAVSIELGSLVSLQANASLYEELQRKLQVLSQFAARLSGLRKEVLQTEMRIRIKNQFLSRLSSCGDLVFPKRRELIQEISSLFKGDIDRFVSDHFQKEELDTLPFYALREEIKQLQAVAKILALSTPVFMQTRLQLSECWDRVKQKDKERKEHSSQKRQVFKQNFELVATKIAPFKIACQEGELTDEECLAKAHEISQLMKELDLGREEVFLLRKELTDSKNLVLDRAQLKLAERKQFLDAEEKKRKEKVVQFQEKIESCRALLEERSFTEVTEQIQQLVDEGKSFSLIQEEKRAIDNAMKLLREGLHAKKMKDLLNLPAESRMALEQLRQALTENEARRLEMKKQIEASRKVLGSSGLDFEKAMLYRETIEEDKKNLEKIEQEIEEITDKIEDME